MIKKYKKPLQDFYFIFRRNKDSLVKPLVVFIDKFGITANLITMFRLFLVILAALLIKWNTILSFWIFVFTYLLDAFDGPLARYQRKATERGALFDLLSDQFTPVVLILGLIFYRKIEAFSATLYLVLFISFVFLNTRYNNLNDVPYFYNKFWVIAAAALWAFTGNNLIDSAIVGLDIYLLIVLIFDIYNLMKAKQ